MLTLAMRIVQIVIVVVKMVVVPAERRSVNQRIVAERCRAA